MANSDNGLFNEKQYKRLEKAVKLLTEYEELKNAHASKNSKAIELEIELLQKYEKSIKRIGYNLNTNLDELKEQYESEKKIYEKIEQQRKEVEKLEKLEYKVKKSRLENNLLAEQQRKQRLEEREFLEDKEKKEKEFNNAIKERTKNEQKLYEIEQKYYKGKIGLNTAAKQYKDEIARQKEEDKNKSKVLNFASSVFGISEGDINAIKDGSYVFNTATKIFSKAVEVFKNSITKGINKNYDTTESVYNKITASNNIGWGTYSNINNTIIDNLNKEGLFNNIGNTDVLNAIADLTSSGGFGLDEAIAKGYQDTVIKYIVPYLDTSSETFNTLEYLMPRNL